MDRKAGTGYRVRSTGKVRKALLVPALLPIAAFCLVLFNIVHSAYAADKWPGVDESVVEKFASERGHAAHKPLINTDQGDLLLFVFLLAGTTGGFAAGYSWRMLVEGKAKGKKSSAKKES
ncbi:MAG: cobalt ABC transporter permease [Geobacteraceae bacterium]